MKKLTQSVFKGCPKHINCACVDYDGTLHLGTTKGNLRNTWASGIWSGIDKIYSQENSGYNIESSLIRRGWMFTLEPEFKHVSEITFSDKIGRNILKPLIFDVKWEYLFIYPAYANAIFKMVYWHYF